MTVSTHRTIAAFAFLAAIIGGAGAVWGQLGDGNVVDDASGPAALHDSGDWSSAFFVSDASCGDSGCCGDMCEDVGCCDGGVLFCAEPVCGYRGLKAGGWLEMGVTTGNRNPVNPAAGRGNLPVGFNYRKDQYQLNQVWAFVEREADTGGCGWDLGGRVDLVYGEDYIFTQAAGLETTDEFVNHWNSAAGGNGIQGTARMGLALPQFYAEAAYNNLTLRLGHFYSIAGYEAVAAPDNFFYSHAYTFPYGEPITHTGGLLTWAPCCGVTMTAGLVNGWDKFDALHDRGSLIFGSHVSSCDRRSSLAFTLITGDEDGSDRQIAGNRTMYSVVLTHQLNACWEYVLQHDLGWQDDDPNSFKGVRDTIWYGASQYLFRTINRCWKAGIRYEWFDDKNGGRIAPFGAYWHELTAGLNWTPNPCMIVRPEVRWDWADFHRPEAPPGPFNDSADRSQFLAAVDLIMTF